MWLLALAVAALAIWLARGRRRLELRALAIGLLVVGLLLLAVQRLAGSYLVDEPREGRRRQAGGERGVEHPDADAGRPRLGVESPSVVVTLRRGAGSSVKRAALARRAAPQQPVFQNRLATYGIAAVVLLVLALLAPLFARGWLMAFVLIAPRHRRHRGDPKDRPAGTRRSSGDRARLMQRGIVRPQPGGG